VNAQTIPAARATIDEEADIDASDDVLLRLSDRAGSLLAVLDDDQRAVVILRFYWDLSYASLTAMPLGTVQQEEN
jgi:DNA-directed RNA polymerase specialized sigma24 family protein